MAITKIDWPTASTPVYTPDIETDYNNQNENLERVARGYNSVSLTNWDATTTAPQVAAGSVIEANGSLYDITTNTAIGTSLATTGVVYLTFNDEATVSFEWEDAVPVWSDPLNGWYVSGDRATGHFCTWDGASSFTEKTNFLNKDIVNIAGSPGGGLDITGGVTASAFVSMNNPSVETTAALANGAYETLSATGLVLCGSNINAQLSGPANASEWGIYDGGSWYVITDATYAGEMSVFSNGSNVRVQNTSGSGAGAGYKYLAYKP